MTVAAPQKRFSISRNTRKPVGLRPASLVGFIFLLLTIPVFSQDFPILYIPKDLSPDRPAPALTPSGRSLVDRPIVSPNFVAPTFPANAVDSQPVQPVPLQPVALSPITQDELEHVIRAGQALEAEARWAEALAHYEWALRSHRNEIALMDYYRIARFHCDVGRRFHDSSYLNLIRTLSVVETLNFYEEVINQIQKEYADTPRWEPLFQHGIQSFSIALADSTFRTKVNLNVADDQVKVYLSSMRTTVDGWAIRDRGDMKNGMIHIAEGAQKQLGLNPAVAIMEFTCGVVNSLDPHTAYLTPNQLNDQFSSIYGNLVGLGVILRSDKESLYIDRVVPGSPASEGGLKVGDRILMVDGISTRGQDTDSAADLLQGKEGSTVRLSIQSSGFGQRPRVVSITRRHIEVPSVEDVRMINNKLGYIKLTAFQTKTVLELTKALNELTGQGMKCLVLDLRQNPGGSFQAGVEVANMFIESGAIVRTQGRGQGPDAPSMARGETWNVPLILLIDEESASASEIVAGAIRDHNRGYLIGRRTYGKGTIQKIIPIQTGSAKNVRSGLKLTTEKFYSPQGWSYSGVGVTPHYTIADVEKRSFLARPLEGIIPRPASSNADDPFIQEAVRVSQNLVQ